MKPITLFLMLSLLLHVPVRAEEMTAKGYAEMVRPVGGATWAVVTQEEVLARTEPNEHSKAIFTIHRGDCYRVMEIRGGWALLYIGEGRENRQTHSLEPDVRADAWAPITLGGTEYVRLERWPMERRPAESNQSWLEFCVYALAVLGAVFFMGMVLVAIEKVIAVIRGNFES